MGEDFTKFRFHSTLDAVQDKFERIKAEAESPRSPGQRVGQKRKSLGKVLIIGSKSSKRFQFLNEKNPKKSKQNLLKLENLIVILFLLKYYLG